MFTKTNKVKSIQVTLCERSFEENSHFGSLGLPAFVLPHKSYDVNKPEGVLTIVNKILTFGDNKCATET